MLLFVPFLIVIFEFPFGPLGRRIYLPSLHTFPILLQYTFLYFVYLIF